jgi:hypothetical protein
MTRCEVFQKICGRQSTEKAALQLILNFGLLLGARQAGSGSCAAAARHQRMKKKLQFKFVKIGHLEKKFRTLEENKLEYKTTS